MGRLTIQLCWLMAICVGLWHVGQVRGTGFRFTNITCDSLDKSLAKVEYCYIGHVDRLKNYMSLSYQLFVPIERGLRFSCRFMINSNGWKPFLYTFEIDMCRFWKTRYNALAKMLFGFINGRTNLNHSCPYHEKHLVIERVMNTDVAKRIPGLPLGKGQYALFTNWSWGNKTRTTCNIYIEVTSE